MPLFFGFFAGEKDNSESRRPGCSSGDKDHAGTDLPINDPPILFSKVSCTRFSFAGFAGSPTLPGNPLPRGFAAPQVPAGEAEPRGQCVTRQSLVTRNIQAGGSPSPRVAAPQNLQRDSQKLFSAANLPRNG